MELISASHSIGQNMYHLEWCPKYRYNMFKQEKNKKLCEDVLHEVAKRHKIKLIELSVMPDHIHTVAVIPPTMSVSKALQLLKGASSHECCLKENHILDADTLKDIFGALGNSTEALVMLMQKP